MKNDDRCHFGSVLVPILLAVSVGRKRFDSRVSAEATALFSVATEEVGSEQLDARWDSLPEPVCQYLQYAISVEAPAIRTAPLQHDGFFRTKPNQNWFAIRGEEYFTVSKPGFVWKGIVWPAPLLWIEARDLLLSGQGNMLVKVNSLIPVANASGPEINQGASLRWLAEAIWFPYAFVAEQVRWEPIDAHSARASLVQGGLPVSATFEFNDQGKLTFMRSDRYRELGDGKAALTPWTAKCSEYREFSGFRVPTSVEVAWEIEQKQFSYARFRITTLEYNNCHTTFSRPLSQRA